MLAIRWHAQFAPPGRLSPRRQGQQRQPGPRGGAWPHPNLLRREDARQVRRRCGCLTLSSSFSLPFSIPPFTCALLSRALRRALSLTPLSLAFFSLFGGCSPSFRPPSCYIYPTPSLPPPAPPLSFARARLLGFLSVEIVGRGGGGGRGLRGSSAKRRRLAFIRSSAFPVPISFCLG